MKTKRKTFSVRIRFEIFKRDNFTCRYCGRKSPEVVLELDHIIPVSKGGTDDPINLTTSCFACNSGKSDKNLSELITGEDPHDKAIELLERERQLAEYYKVRDDVEKRIIQECHRLIEIHLFHGSWQSPIISMLRKYDFYTVSEALEITCERKNRSREFVPYTWGILRNLEKDALSKS